MTLQDLPVLGFLVMISLYKSSRGSIFGTQIRILVCWVLLRSVFEVLVL